MKSKLIFPALVALMSTSMTLLPAAAAEDSLETIEARQLIARIKKGDSEGTDSPRIGVLREWNITITSVTQTIPEAELKRLYVETCTRLEKLWGTKLSAWKDRDGWGSRAAVLKITKQDHLVREVTVGLFRGNDSLSFCCYTSQEPEDRTKYYVPMKSWHLDAEAQDPEKPEPPGKPDEPR